MHSKLFFAPPGCCIRFVKSMEQIFNEGPVAKNRVGAELVHDRDTYYEKFYLALLTGYSRPWSALSSGGFPRTLRLHEDLTRRDAPEPTTLKTV